jgi:hypothetical protein
VQEIGPDSGSSWRVDGTTNPRTAGKQAGLVYSSGWDDTQVTLTAPPPSAAVPEEGVGQLLRGIAAGDRACLAELYDTLSARVYGVLTRVVDTDAAAALLLEVFDEVWRTARASTAIDDGDAWVLRIARRRAIIAARALQPRPSTASTARPISG